VAMCHTRVALSALTSVHAGSSRRLFYLVARFASL
jgi:hypothetical protein